MKIIYLFKFILTILKGFPLRFVEILGQVLPENTAGCKLRGLMYKPFLKKCGKNFQVGLSAKLEFLNNIEVNDNVYIGHGCWISGINGGIIFEDEVMLGPNVKMVSSNHTFHDGSARFAKSIGTPIKICRGSWIASGVIITAGTTIGASSLVAAGAVVTKSFPNNSIIDIYEKTWLLG